MEWLDAVYLDSVGAVRVEWALLPMSPPQLSYRIEVRKEGTVIAYNANTRPEQRNTTFQTGRLVRGSYIASLTIFNIFDKRSVNYGTEFTVA